MARPGRGAPATDAECPLSSLLAIRLLRTLPPRTGGTVHVAAVAGGERRLVLWPGEGPDERPAHGALGTVLGRGVFEGEAIWAEELPPGSFLADLPPGSGGAAAALADVVEALGCLHAEGFAHGGLDASCVVVGVDGRGRLLGAVGEGAVEEDLAALDVLLGKWAPETRRDGSLAELAAALRAQEATAPGALPAADTLVDEGPTLELVLEPLGSLDEVGFDLGPDEGERGLLDTWAGRTMPGEDPTGAIEVTGGVDGNPGAITALLAHLAAGVARDASAARFAPHEGRPSRAVKACIADEPLDPLPVPEGLPLSGTSFLEPGGHTDITAVADRPAAQLDVTEELDRTSSNAGLGEAELSPKLLLFAVLAALVAGAVGAWLVLT